MGPSSKDVVMLVKVGTERMVRPLVVLGGNNVGVGVEKDCGEVGIGARPFEEDQRLALHELLGMRLEAMDFAWERMKSADSAY
ncbi:hypothetical protein FH972_008304 [Carpinus fangiana]|uniref:Uncharacterized protein n=1 Tax=Carpinus fangiana TaxID=176857 RepID=A0A5N6R0L8_9ROSI|nr:hypothetical protein FH972_008304 [Carpinus fangiana]